MLNAHYLQLLYHEYAHLASFEKLGSGIILKTIPGLRLIMDNTKYDFHYSLKRSLKILMHLPVPGCIG